MRKRLTVRTDTLGSSPDLVGGLPERGGLLWVRGGQGLAGHGEAARIDAGTGAERFTRAGDQLGELFTAMDTTEATPLAFASFSFDARTGGSVLVVPQVVWGHGEGRSWRTVVGDAAPAPEPDRLGDPRSGDRRIRYAGSSMPDVHWLEAVATATRRIEAGELDKVVLARDHALWSRTPFDARVLARRLAGAFPDCYTFLVDGLVGATPELLVRRRGPEVESLVLAGTAGRAAGTADDAVIGKELLASDKDRREHDLAVTSVADVLAPACAELHVDAEPFLLRLANVQHLATRVRGTLHGRPWPSALDLAGALHPTAAVCGTPRRDANTLIRELEGMDRGRYAGPVGWVDANGDGEFGIALRCAQLSGARARLFAGSGIVAGSLPEAELEETRLKLRAMQAAFQG